MILAFDTSNYTTSVAIVDDKGIILDERWPIVVKIGDRGIRQSDAFFQHMTTLKMWLTNDYTNYVDKIKGVAVSTRPRAIEGSYMPVFNAGETIAIALSNSLKVPLFKCSHQEGHLMAAKHEIATLPSKYLFLHLSGGTTEMHFVTEQGDVITLDRIAETADISLGQLVDRIGVKTGLAFPCGPVMDKTAMAYAIANQPPRFITRSEFNLSGYENYYLKLFESGLSVDNLYYHLFNTIAIILTDLIDFGLSNTTANAVLVAGGVAASQTVRQILSEHNRFAKVSFAKPHLSSDNACGVALIGLKKLKY